MGLDMYLRDRDGQEIVYWRKANQINAWFDRWLGGVDNVTDYEVNRDLLEVLLVDCYKVIDILNEGKKVYDEEYPDYYVFEDLNQEIFNIMPPMEGFFFGGTEIDRWYEEDILYTIKNITELLDYYDFNEPLYYWIWY